jgi:hypothetical protein
MLTRFSAGTLRVWVALSVVLCTSCAHLPVARHGSESTPGRSVGRFGCGPPISYQVFQKDACGADWSKAHDLLAYNAKGSDGRYHIYTVKPDGANPAQFGVGAANTGRVLWMSNAGNPSHGTDWWTMRPDGSNPQRLSDFNVGGNTDPIGHKPVYATVLQTANWGPDNSYLYGDVETNR